MTARITRHFVTVGNRRVHYTRAGSGPVVAMLHASPCSAKVMRLPQTIFAERFTAIAFDTPGFGLSDLLPIAQPETEDLADALAETLAALGIEQAATYGRHTGAQIAVEYAARQPRRCAMALTDGFPIFSADVQAARLARYLVPLESKWDGSHLLWLWFRYREQHVFWPWNEHDLAHRSDADVPDVDFLHRGVIELLEAGDGYRVGYATAYRHRGLAALADLRVPVCFGVRPGDSQMNTLPRFPAGTWTQIFARDAREAALAERDVLLRHPAAGAAPPAPSCAPIAGRTTTDYVTVGDRQVLVRTIGNLRGDAVPVVFLHRLPGSSFLDDALVRALGATRPVIALDLAGHGESDPLAGNDQTIAALAADVWRVLDRLGVGRVALAGQNGGASVALDAAHQASDRVTTLLLEAPVALAPGERAAIAARWLEDVEPLVPRWDGTHLVRAWHHRRDQALWWPWFDRRHTAARRGAPLALDTDAMTLEVREQMKQPASFAPAWHAVMAYPFVERLAAWRGRVALLAAAGDLFGQCLPVAAEACGAQPVVVDATVAARAAAIIAALG